MTAHFDRDDVAHFQPLVTAAAQQPAVTARIVDRANIGTVPAGALASGAVVERINAATAAEHRAEQSRRMVTQPAPAPPAPPTQHTPAPGLDTAGVLGAAVSDVLRLDRVEGTARRVRSRVDGEVQEIAAAQETAVRDARDRVINDAVTAAAAKSAVPATLAPMMHEFEHVHLQRSPSFHAAHLLEALGEWMTTEAGDRVHQHLGDVDALVIDAARGALADAAQASERLTLAGLTVDVADSELVDLGDAGALSARKLWRAAVAQWVDAQAVRQWVAAVLDRGFTSTAGKLDLTPPPRVRSGAYAETVDNGPTAEDRTQGSVWVGVATGQVSVTGVAPNDAAHGALRWWCTQPEAKRPQPSGVTSSAHNAGASSKGA